MKTYLDCIPCFFRQALAAARMSTDDQTIHRRVLNSVSTMIPDLALDVTPPEIAQKVYRMVYEITGNNDPYLEVKKCANTSAMTFYPHMKDIVDKLILIIRDLIHDEHLWLIQLLYSITHQI